MRQDVTVSCRCRCGRVTVLNDGCSSSSVAVFFKPLLNAIIFCAPLAQVDLAAERVAVADAASGGRENRVCEIADAQGEF